jgi:uncharacterized sulfatase
VAKLKEDRLLQDTFVFYLGDHGGVLPRSKGYAYESGLHIPLVVRVPRNFEHLVDEELGARVNGFVSLCDFGPPALQLAGVEAPKQVDGKAFLGKGISIDEVNARDEAFGEQARSLADEVRPLLKALRSRASAQRWLQTGNTGG